MATHTTAAQHFLKSNLDLPGPCFLTYPFQAKGVTGLHRHGR